MSTVQIKERPILFKGEMVRAILENKKTQTRRVYKYAPAASKLRLNEAGTLESFLGEEMGGLPESDPDAWFPVIGRLGCETAVKCPYGKPGDRLWVRETWADVNTENGPAILYKADTSYHFCADDAYPVEYERYPNCKFTMWCGDLLRGEEGHAWRSPIFMPRWASRITLEIVKVRVERLQAISEEDAKAEGAPEYNGDYWPTNDEHRTWYRKLWDSINGKDHPWESNPWVWVIEFKRILNEPG